MNATAVIRFQVEGFHNWLDAPHTRKYLASLHRHIFHVEAHLSLAHNEREVEFHNFLDFCKTHFPGGNMWAKSCETMASELAMKIDNNWPNRKVKVSIFEDNEVGAIVCNYPEDV